MALLFECMGKCCRNTLDTADIVRDACYQQFWSLVGIGPMQVYSIPDAMRQTLIPTLVMVMFATCSTLADVRVEPSFGHPYVFGDRIVFTSVDRTHLIAIDKKGRLQWEMAFPAPIFEQRSDEEFLVQSERHVYKVDVANGTKSQVFVMPENEVLIAGFAKNFLAAADHRFDHNHLRIINCPASAEMGQFETGS